jgi:protein-tyrosine phosphatase
MNLAKSPKLAEFLTAVRAVHKDFGKYGLKVKAAEAVGVLETLGLTYPVSSYEHVVSPSLVRGSRIDKSNQKAGYKKLFEQGIRSIVDLTLEKVDDPKAVADAGLKFLNIPITDNTAPKIEQMKAFLDFVAKQPPCYVHCEAGKGRTGVAVACYRMAVQHWPLEEALAEAKEFGLELANQIDFLDKFSKALKANKVDGYHTASA